MHRSKRTKFFEIRSAFLVKIAKLTRKRINELHTFKGGLFIHWCAGVWRYHTRSELQLAFFYLITLSIRVAWGTKKYKFMEEGFAVLTVFLIMFLIAVFIVGLWIVSEVAKKRGRNKVGWMLFSLVITPVIASFFLVCLGEKEEQKRKRIESEERVREKVRQERLDEKSSAKKSSADAFLDSL